ncbi:DIL and ankyrin domain-containing protein [Choiromyces venosus 120613-1]|uniref:DIL and ankyrin domain-containing protein n=1 Tax=Choiromyces venosus 120613-1 TaxID=1336337 RepID=A0A3N4JQR7_9PEZI|nr:DIL and ankyrin domain-containing protein [Choiromyces venosus 120613-1]
MDLGDPYDDGSGFDVATVRPRVLPPDLPRSLNDRRRTPPLTTETEVYDAWQGEAQFITAPVPARLNFNLDPDYRDDDDELVKGIADSDSRLVSMLAAQEAFRMGGSGLEDEDDIVRNPNLSEEEKKESLQKALNMAASNGDEARIRRILGGEGRGYVDVNAPDEEGTSPLIYASCFGHEDVVSALLDAGANVDQQDRHQWSALMWAMTNRHKGIAKLLLDHGASPEIRSSSGRTAFDFVSPNSEISDYLHRSGYIGTAGVSDDFYDNGLAQERFEEEMAENEMKRRMMMESAINLEVDLSSLGLDEQPESPGDEGGDELQDFVWDKCLNDQMFVFQEHELNRMLDVVITNMLPQRSPSQKPVPANVLFLSARYAHYHSSPELLSRLLLSAMDKINNVVDMHQLDMTILAFWISNANLLLHYLKKDAGLVGATIEFQQHLSELINEIFILILRDAERRMDRVMDRAMLDHETIPGFEDVHFQNEWRLFKSKRKSPEPSMLEKRYRPPSPKQRAKPAPRNITSLLSSTLFVLDLYDIHSVIISQVLSQLFYWIGAELFNRIMSNRKYLARTKAMQIRLNVSILEDWARTNNRQPEHYESGALTTSGENVVGAARRHLAPVIQLLQWLQCFSSLGEDFDALKSTVSQLTRLNPEQLLHSTKNYRPEVGEKGLSREGMKYLVDLKMRNYDKKHNRAKSLSASTPKKGNSANNTPTSPVAGNNALNQPPLSSPQNSNPSIVINEDEEDYAAEENLLLDPGFMLPFSLPTNTDMLISYGAGLGGMNREREKKYQPSVPPEYLAKLDFSNGSTRNGGTGGGGAGSVVSGWEDEG